MTELHYDLQSYNFPWLPKNMAAFVSLNSAIILIMWRHTFTGVQSQYLTCNITRLVISSSTTWKRRSLGSIWTRSKKTFNMIMVRNLIIVILGVSYRKWGKLSSLMSTYIISKSKTKRKICNSNNIIRTLISMHLYYLHFGIIFYKWQHILSTFIQKTNITWGVCLWYPLFPNTTINKLQACSIMYVILEYSSNHRGYKCYDLFSHKIIISHNVIF